MANSEVGIPLLKFREIRIAWATQIVTRANWTSLFGIIGKEFNVGEGYIPSNQDIQLCSNLLEEIAEYATALQFIQALGEIDRVLANNIAKDIASYSALLPLAQPPGDACFFFLFTPDVSALPIINQFLEYGVPFDQKTIQLEGLKVTRFKSTNPRLVIVIAQISQEDGVEQFIDFIGQIPNLVIVHKEPTQIGCTQFCLINDNNTFSNAADAILHCHDDCRSQVQRISNEDLRSAAPICTRLSEVSNDRAVIILNDKKGEEHLFCFLETLIRHSSRPMFPITDTSLLHLSFNDKKDKLELNNAITSLFHHRLIISVDTGAELVASVSTYQSCAIIFNANELKSSLNKYLLTLTNVRPFRVANLQRLLVLPEDQQKLRIIGEMLSVTIDTVDLPVPDGIIYTTDDVIADYIQQQPIQPNQPPLHILPMDCVNNNNNEDAGVLPIWLAKGSDVYARDLQIHRQRFLQNILARNTQLMNGHIFAARTRYWLATQSGLDLHLYKVPETLKYWSKEETISTYKLYQMSVHAGQYRIVVGNQAAEYHVNVQANQAAAPPHQPNNPVAAPVQGPVNPAPNPPPQPNNPVVVPIQVGGPQLVVFDNRLVLVPDQNFALVVRNSLLNLNFAATAIADGCQCYQRNLQRIYVVRYTHEKLVLVTDLMRYIANRFIFFTHPNLHPNSPEMLAKQLVQRIIDLIQPQICPTYEITNNININLDQILDAFLNN